jgi:ABC-type multidrug transport system ATPase subunit
LPVLVKGLTSRNRISQFLAGPVVDRYKRSTASSVASKICNDDNNNDGSLEKVSFRAKKPLSRSPNSLSISGNKNELQAEAGPSRVAFDVRDASFSWPASSLPALTGINLKIESGTLTVISGPAGSGKTSLILSLIDELKLLSGSVSCGLDPRIALV